MWHLAFGVKQDVCDAAVLQTSPNFPCYDMASGLSGDFVADGEVNLFDLSLQIRMLFGGGMDMASQYMSSSATAAWQYRSAADCTRRRELAATILKSWSVTCPQTIPTDCYYDCVEDAACKVSVAPQLSNTLTEGSWFDITLPTPWVGVSLLFTDALIKCTIVDCNNQAASLAKLTQSEINSQCAASTADAGARRRCGAQCAR